MSTGNSSQEDSVESANILPAGEIDTRAATRVFLAMVSAWFIPHGLQIVLYPWLLAVYLELPAQQVGLGQMLLQIPGLFLVLWAGSLADRIDTRGLLRRLHTLAAVPPVLLAALIWTGHFSFPVLVVYGFAMGACVAFANPSRDAMLATVAKDNIQRVVIATTGVQFGVQIIGYAIAMLAGVIGPAPILVIQSLIMLTGRFIAPRLPPRQIVQNQNVDGKKPRGSVWQGFKIVRDTPQIRSVMLVSLAGSILYLGAFFVLIPLLIRDYYGGGAKEIGLVNIGFMVGTLLMVWILLRSKNIRRQGRAYLLANIWGATLALSVISTGISFPMMMMMLGIWGAAAGIGMSMSRTIIQQYTPESHRARVFAVYQLCFMGGGPLGSLMMGYLIQHLGPLQAAKFPPMGMVVVLILVVVFTDLWKLEAPKKA
ncbi:MAG: MFS transporter [Immundisolibacteraceae bacterium]|nr:MFS transporter [Immundisolibacteraceae bacterium]